jgi:hypothetical protein
MGEGQGKGMTYPTPVLSYDSKKEKNLRLTLWGRQLAAGHLKPPYFI